MVSRKHNSTAGFSLIEVLVAITILGFVVVPIGSSLVLSFRLNARSEDMVQAQLAVSSAVETMMAEGYDPDTHRTFETNFKVNIVAYPDENDDGIGDANQVYYELTVSDEAGLVSVDTCVRPAPTEEEGDGA